MQRGPRLGLLWVLILALFTAAGGAAKEVYVFEVSLEKPLGNDVIHILGVAWELGDQAWVFLAPVEEGEAVYAITGNVTNVKIYDARRIYVVVPAQPPPRGRAAAYWLETQAGRYPVELAKPRGGVVETWVGSVDEMYKTLEEMGYRPKYMGKARLVRSETQDRGPAASDLHTLTAAPTGAPAVGTTYTVYGGVYFRPLRIDSLGIKSVPPVIQSSLNGKLCYDVSTGVGIPDATYVGYDANELYLGTYILGGRVSGRLIVETYTIESLNYDVMKGYPCRLAGRLEFNLVNKTRYFVRHVNSTISSSKPLVIRVLVHPTSISGAPRVSVNASVAYTRTYRHGFEMNEYMSYVAGETVTINQYVSRMVLGPYVMPEGIAGGTHRAVVRLVTSMVSGSCPPLYVDLLINNVLLRSTYVYGSLQGVSCLYNIDVSAPVDPYTVSWSKSFAGGFFYILRIRYSGSLAPPYVYSITAMPHEALRGWRWAEVWRTVSGGLDIAWQYPYTATEIQLLATRYPPQSSSTLAPLVLVHGIFSFRNDGMTSGGPLFVVGVAGVRSDGMVSYPLKTFTAHLRFSRDVSGAFLLKAFYSLPAGLEEIREPWWLYYAKLAKGMVDFAVAFLDLGRVASVLYAGISFAVDRALDTAYTQPSVSNIDSYTVKISWTRGWADNKQNDKVYLLVSVPSTKFVYPYSTRVTVTHLNIEYVSYSPSLTWYLHPTDPGIYSYVGQPAFKSWIFGGVVSNALTFWPG